MMEYYFPSFTQGKKHCPRTRSFHLVRTLAAGGQWIEQTHHTHARALPQSESTIRCRVRVDQSFLSPPLLAMAMVGERPATHNGIAERDGFSFTHPHHHTHTDRTEPFAVQKWAKIERKETKRKKTAWTAAHTPFRVSGSPVRRRCLCAKSRAGRAERGRKNTPSVGPRWEEKKASCPRGRRRRK